jgi:hypothetical protein
MARTDMCRGFATVERRCGAFGTHSARRMRGMPAFGENSDGVSMEPISPELALVDPDLAARARVMLPDPAPPQARLARLSHPVPETAAPTHRPYPFWARVTAALWLLVIGILIGGAAIPHAQDTPRVIPANDDPAFCPAPDKGKPTRRGP